MSHTSKADTSGQNRIVNLSALERAAKSVGLEFRRDQTTFRTWETEYGELVGDTPLPEGTNARDFIDDRCDHALGIPNNTSKGTNAYEIGVVRKKDNSGEYELLYDSLGGALERHAGKGLKTLLMHYRMENCRDQAESLGDGFTTETLPTGEIVAHMDATVRMGT